MKISAVIIARNEEDQIKDCIKTLAFADEVIVIDNGSKDKTAEVAAKMKAKIFSVSGLDFSYLRNVGKEKAGGEWLFYIDTDERVSEELAKEIEKTVKTEKKSVAFDIIRQNYFFGKLWPKKEQLVRLMKKEALLGWQGSVHESPIVTGKIGQLENPLLHYTHSDLTGMVKKTNEWSEIEAQLRFKNNHPRVSWWRIFRVMFTSFWQSYITDGGWQVGTTGLIESIYQSFSTFITYAKLWEKQNNRKPKC